MGNCGEIRVAGAGADAGVVRIGAVEFVVIVAVVGQDCPVECGRPGEDVRVVDLLVRPAVFVGSQHIMGHADPSMGGHYRERVEDIRLQAVPEHVRAWLEAAWKLHELP